MNRISNFIDKNGLRDGVAGLIESVAAKAILPRFQNLADRDIRTKSGPTDLVTAADDEAERLLFEGLTQLLPDSYCVGEEAVAGDSSVLSYLSGPKPVWIVDPLDGTANFVAGYGVFAVAVALIYAEETLMGWIHDPLNRLTIWGGQGRGTWLGGKRLLLEGRQSGLANMAAAHYHRAFRTSENTYSSSQRCGSAAHEYWALAENRLQISSFSRLYPWDHAAGVLIHSEAGGYSRLVDGSIYKPAVKHTCGILSAPSKVVWEQVRALVSEENL